MKRILTILMLVLSAIFIAGCSSGDAITLITPDAYVEQFEDVGTDHLLIDVRTPQEFASGHIAGAINIPVEQLANRLSEVSTSMPIVVYCQSGNRSGQASTILAQNEYDDIYDLGGIARWRSAGYPVQ